jgi:hypothetical protein
MRMISGPDNADPLKDRRLDYQHSSGSVTRCLLLCHIVCDLPCASTAQAVASMLQAAEGSMCRVQLTVAQMQVDTLPMCQDSDFCDYLGAAHLL